MLQYSTTALSSFNTTWLVLNSATVLCNFNLLLCLLSNQSVRWSKVLRNCLGLGGSLRQSVTYMEIKRSIVKLLIKCIFTNGPIWSRIDFELLTRQQRHYSAVRFRIKHFKILSNRYYYLNSCYCYDCHYFVSVAKPFIVPREEPFLAAIKRVVTFKPWLLHVGMFLSFTISLQVRNIITSVYNITVFNHR